jgi:thymidine kinase
MGTGSIEVICGPMFSGKTEELVKRLRRAQIARQRVKVFKPRIDDRYDASDVVSHSRQRIESIPVDSSDDVRAHLAREPADVVGIDEAQFFDEGIVDVAEELADGGTRVVVAGLELDYLARPFGSMWRLLALAEEVTKQLAICISCGAPASRSQRVNPEAARLMRGGDLEGEQADQVLVGSEDSYEARCRRCFVKGIDVPSMPMRKGGSS